MSPISACDQTAIPTPRGSLAATVLKLLADADDVIDRDREAARACIIRASALLRDDVQPAPAAPAFVQGGLAPWQIARVKGHIEAHLDSTLRMGDLAAIARLSTGHFCRSFTRSLGVGPFAYVAGRRLARAQALMLTTDQPLSHIALACGLCDQSHLTRLFRRHVGTSPNVWRRSHKGGPDASSGAQPAPSPKSRYLPAMTKAPSSLPMHACVQS